MIVAFRQHTLLLDDRLYALQPSIPHLTQLALHRCLQRHGISRLPDVEGDKPKRWVLAFCGGSWSGLCTDLPVKDVPKSSHFRSLGSLKLWVSWHRLQVLPKRPR
jgi:hypothetical protein